MRIAIPIWGNRISPVLDVAQQIYLIDLDSRRVHNKLSISLDSKSLSERAVTLKKSGVEKVICGAISEFFYQLLNNQKIEVLPWVTGNIEDVLHAFTSGHITDPCFRMPGCFGRAQRGRFGRRRGCQTRTSKGEAMKVTITANGTTFDAEIDPRFGRARYFLLIDPETRELTVYDNQQNQQAAGGVGIQAAESIVNAGASVLLTGHCGPKAFRALQAAGVKIVLGVEGNVKTVVDKFNNGEYVFADSADVESHW